MTAASIVKLPTVKEEELIFRYGKNGFAIYGLPLPKENSILGLLGRNGIGKTTAMELLTGKKKINFGKEDATEKEIKKFFQGSEFLKYFQKADKTISYKPQNLSSLAQDVKVHELLKKLGNENKISELIKKLKIENILENKLNKISGGELQKVAIIAASIKEAEVYFFDEPLAFLDIEERIRVSDFIRELSRGKIVIVIEHDLLIMDYLTEYTNIFFGQPGCFGLVSGIKSTRYGINSYLDGYLKEENIKIRDKPLNFNLTKHKNLTGRTIGTCPAFEKKYENFMLKVKKGEIKENCVVGILGKNGTGKTTFVKCLAGLEKVKEEGKSPEKPLNLDLKISYKPQYLHNVEEEKNIPIAAIMAKEKINKKIASTFNLENIYQKSISQLSGGELQRFSIARCLAKEADVYLLDEPSAYLDIEERISVAKAIKELMNEKQKTAFVVDHDLLLMSYVSDNIIVFSGEPGKIGETSELLNLEEGISLLLKQLDITLRKDKDTGRPKINDKDSVLDREQKKNKEWVIF